MSITVQKAGLSRKTIIYYSNCYKTILVSVVNGEKGKRDDNSNQKCHVNYTTDHSRDIFGDMFSSFVSGKLSDLWLNTYEQKLAYEILFNCLTAWENYLPSSSPYETTPWMVEPFIKTEIDELSLDAFAHQFKANETSIFLLQNYQYLRFGIKRVTGKGNLSEVGQWIINKQKPDGSFESDDCTNGDLSLAVSSKQDQTYVNTLVGLMALHFTQKQISQDNQAINAAFDRGLAFMERNLNADETENLKSIDNFELSLLADLYSSIKHKDAKDVQMKLKERSSSYEDGIYWTSNFNNNLCDSNGVSASRNFSLVATAHALMSYVNLNDSDSFEVARWLVAQRNQNGIYDSLEDTFLVMKNSGSFMEQSHVHFSLIQESVEYFAPARNQTVTGIEFTLNVRKINLFI